MPQGLQVWDASGNLTLDTSTSVGRHTGTQDIGVAPTFSGTITVPGYASPSVVWYMAQFSTTLGDPPDPYVFGDGFFSVSGAVISWEAYTPTKIVYGIY